MSNPHETKIGEVTRQGDFYRVIGETKDGKRGSVEIPVSTLDSLPKRDGERLMQRGVFGAAQGDK